MNSDAICNQYSYSRNRPVLSQLYNDMEVCLCDQRDVDIPTSIVDPFAVKAEDVNISFLAELQSITLSILTFFIELFTEFAMFFR